MELFPVRKRQWTKRPRATKPKAVKFKLKPLTKEELDDFTEEFRQGYLHILGMYWTDPIFSISQEEIDAERKRIEEKGFLWKNMTLLEIRKTREYKDHAKEFREKIYE